MYKKLYYFLLRGCEIRTNCGCGCPFSAGWIPDDSFADGRYHCNLKRLDENELQKLFNKVEAEVDIILNN